MEKKSNNFYTPKHNTMPTINLTTASTVDIIDYLLEIVTTTEQTDAVNELKYREIESGDTDADSKHIGGTRPTHQPPNP